MKPTRILYFLLLLSAGLTAQDETITIIQRGYFPADRFQAAIKANEDLNALYRQHGVTTPMTAWVFDDNTIEYVWEVESMSDFDLINDEYAAARVRIGAERVQELRLPPTKQEFWFGGEVDELSYVPEGVDLSEMKYIKVLRARIKTDDMEEFQRVAAEEAELAKKQNRQTPFYLEMYPVGLGTREFEVVEFGRDRADFERREAESKKTHYSSKEYKAWEKRRDRVAEVISVRTAVRNEALSIPKPEDAAAEPDTYLYVTEMDIAAGQREAAMNYMATNHQLSTEYHYPQASSFATTTDGQTLMNFVSVDRFAGLDLLNARNQQMRYAPAEALARVRRDDKGIFTGQRDYLLRRDKSLEYEPADLRDFPDDQPSSWMLTVYDYPYGKGRAADQLLQDIKAAYEKANSSIAYDVFWPAFGGAGQQVWVVTWGSDMADLNRRVAEGNAALPAAERTALDQRMYELFSISRRVTGTSHFDKRYVPRTASNE